MNRAEAIEVAMVVCGILLLATSAVMIYDAMQPADDGTPDWAKDAANRLDKSGGKIGIYREFGDTNTTTSAKFDLLTVGVESDVSASSTGLTVKIGGTLTHIPYERLAYVIFNI